MADGQENSNSSASAQPGTGEALANDGQYIVIEHYNAEGKEVTGYSRIAAATVDAHILEPNETAAVNALATVQNDSGSFEVAPSGIEQVSFTCFVVLIVGVFMCLGAIASRTLLKSFERK